MTQDEIATMDGGMCILQLRGVRPFFSFPRTQKLVSDMLAIRRGEADGSIKELVSNAMSGYGRTPFRGNDVQTS